jgi:hypothetical protein
VIRALKDYNSMKFIINNTDDEVKGLQDRMIGCGFSFLKWNARG